jgi:TolB protein
LTHDGHFKQRPCWSPDGQRLLFTRHARASLRLYLRSIATGEEVRVTEAQETEQDAEFSPDGREIAFTINQPGFTQSDVNVHRLTLSDKTQTPVSGTEGQLSHEEYPTWSPDGAWIASTSTRDGNQELYVCRIDGSERRRLTSDPAHDAHPHWSPDGALIALATDRWGDLELAVIRPDGGGLRRLTYSRGIDDFPAWSPDGLRLAFVSQRDGDREVYVLERDGGEPRRRTFNPGRDEAPCWSPDGRLTIVSQHADGFDIFIEAAPSAGPRAPREPVEASR